MLIKKILRMKTSEKSSMLIQVVKEVSDHGILITSSPTVFKASII